MDKISIIIIEDHALIRETWSFVLNADSRFSVFAECSSAEEGLDMCKTHRCDIVILDINLPDMCGIDAVPLIRKYAPGIKILGVSLHTQPSLVQKMIQNGARGYVTKTSPLDEMVNALIVVQNGGEYICEEIRSLMKQEDEVAGKRRGNVHLLSIREIEIIKYIARGMSSKDIAEVAGISIKTVEVHRYHILKKLGLKNAAALVNYVNKQALL